MQEVPGSIPPVASEKKEGIICSFVWVFAWFYINSLVSPARRDIFVTSQGTDSYYLGPSSSSSSSNNNNNRKRPSGNAMPTRGDGASVGCVLGRV